MSCMVKFQSKDRAFEQIGATRVKPGKSEISGAGETLCASWRSQHHSAGLAEELGGAPPVIFAAAAFFSTMRTAMIEPS